MDIPSGRLLHFNIGGVVVPVVSQLLFPEESLEINDLKN